MTCKTVFVQLDDVLELLIENGFEGLVEYWETQLNDKQAGTSQAPMKQ